MSEIYRAGAALTRGLSRAAGYLGKRSDEASARLRRAAEEAELRRVQTANNPDPAPKSGVEEFRERADAWADDLSEKLRTALARAKEEGPEIAQAVRREASEAISRINAAVSERGRADQQRDDFMSSPPPIRRLVGVSVFALTPSGVRARPPRPVEGAPPPPSPS